MKALFAAILILFGCASKAAPTMTLNEGGALLTLTTEACNPTVTGMLHPKFAPQFRDASAVIAGKTVAACWIMHDEKTIYVHFEDGEGAMIAISRFLKTSPQSKSTVDNWKNNS